KNLSESLKKLLGTAVPDLYPKLDLGARPLKGDEAELLLKTVDLKALPQVFYAGEHGLGLVVQDGAKLVPNPAADVAKEVFDYLVSEHSYGNKDTRTGRALERRFGGMGLVDGQISPPLPFRPLLRTQTQTSAAVFELV